MQSKNSYSLFMNAFFMLCIKIIKEEETKKIDKIPNLATV
jgi:hypothetical protein